MLVSESDRLKGSVWCGLGEQRQRHMEGNQAVQEDYLAGNRDPAGTWTETHTGFGCCHRDDSTFVVTTSYDSRLVVLSSLWECFCTRFCGRRFTTRFACTHSSSSDLQFFFRY